MKGEFDMAAIAVFSTYFSTAYRYNLVGVFKVSCFPFLNCFASFLLDIIFLPGLTAEYPAILKLYPQKGQILGHKAYYQGGYVDTWIRS